MKYSRHSEALLRRAGAVSGPPLKFRIETESWESALRFAAHGLGVLICPLKMAESYLPVFKLVAIPISDAWTNQTIKIIYKSGRLNSLAKRLVDHLVNRHKP